MFRNWIVIGVLAAIGLILIGYWFSLTSVPDGVTPQGDSDEWLKAIAAIAGGITTLSASIFGALSKLNEYKKAKLDIEAKRLEIEEKRRKQAEAES
jgi:hypothetical protein